MAISSELEQLLASWIPRQPWFPKLAADFGTDPDITPMSVARAFTYTAEELGGFVGLVTVISVGDGPTLRRLNIPLSLRGTEDIHLRHALIGQIDDLALGQVWVYDGAADPVFVNLMADAITKRKVFDGGQLSTESLRHSQEKSASRASSRDTQSGMPFPVTSSGAGSTDSAGSTDTGAEAVPPKPSKAALLTEARAEAREEMPVDIRPIEVSDSGPHKSTVIIHDEYEPMELSFFRVLENGMPSSLTIPVLLTEAGSRSVPEVIGWGSGRWYDMFEVTEMEAPMALLSHVDIEGEPAWREAVDIVCAVDSGSIGAYNAHAAEMGRRIGELHSDMAAEFGIVEGTGAPTVQLVKKWIERIDWALGRAPLALDSLVPELRGHRQKLQSLETIGSLQKIHGELTLDHVVSSPSDGYSVVKFTDSTNSDPKPVALDLVALLRSVDYAAGFARLQRTEELDSEDGGLVVNGFGNDPSALRAIFDSPEYLWASQVQNSLLSGYSRARGESIGLSDPVLRAALIDRLLVEVVTELRNRPNWLSVPLATLTLVLKGKPSRSGDLPTEVELSAPEVETGAAEAASGTSAAESGTSEVGPGTSEVGSAEAELRAAGIGAGVGAVAIGRVAAAGASADDSGDAVQAGGSEAESSEEPTTVPTADEVDKSRAGDPADITYAHRVEHHDSLVDGVSTEAVTPVEPSTSASEAAADTTAFDEPNVEAPARHAADTDAHENAASEENSETAEATGSTDASTSVVGARKSDGEKRAEEVKISGGAHSTETLVDGVTQEPVEPTETVGNIEPVEPGEPSESAEPGASGSDAESTISVAAADRDGDVLVAGPDDADDVDAEVPTEAAADADDDLGLEDIDADADEEEPVVRRVPASFAARGATSEDADSTGHDVPPAKPSTAPNLGKHGSDSSAESSTGSVFGEFSDKLKNADKSKDPGKSKKRNKH
ncbi:maltokinase N-terminal cap-like domain-containing protein [Brevibacterium sp. GP-SGM9]|uniref:maltokinase N-terminal cap-like domain-containing protein n=1 Tax=Brevibacterium sp. GP-SGM9 TaxID=3376990 RepID=UPI0039A6B567